MTTVPPAAHSRILGHTSETPEVGVLQHIGIVVGPDQHDPMVTTLCDVLRGVVLEVGHDDRLDVRWTWIGTPSAPVLEVLSPRTAIVTPVSRFLELTGGGLHHLSFEVGDIDQCFSALEARGLPLTGRSRDHSGWSEFFLNPRLTHGALLHWMQPVTAERATMSERAREHSLLPDPSQPETT